MQEDNDFISGTELHHKLCEYGGEPISDFIEEDTETVGFRNNTATVKCGELYIAVLSRRKEMGKLETILFFCSPLLLFSKTPQDKEA